MWRPLMRYPSAIDKKKNGMLGYHDFSSWMEDLVKHFLLKGEKTVPFGTGRSREREVVLTERFLWLWQWASFVLLVHSIERVWAVDGQLEELTPVSDIVEVCEELLFWGGQDSGLTWWGQDRSLWSELVIKVTNILPSFNGGDKRRPDLFSQQSSPVHVLMERGER